MYLALNCSALFVVIRYSKYIYESKVEISKYFFFFCNFCFISYAKYKVRTFLNLITEQNEIQKTDSESNRNNLLKN